MSEVHYSPLYSINFGKQSRSGKMSQSKPSGTEIRHNSEIQNFDPFKDVMVFCQSI